MTRKGAIEFTKNEDNEGYSFVGLLIAVKWRRKYSVQFVRNWWIRWWIRCTRTCQISQTYRILTFMLLYFNSKH